MHVYNNWNKPLYRGPVKSDTRKSIFSNKIITSFYAYYSTMSGRTKRFYLGQNLAKADQYLERAKMLCHRYPLGIDFFLLQTN